MFQRFISGFVTTIAVLGLFASIQSARADIVGTDVIISSQDNEGFQTTSPLLINGGAVLSYGDAGAFAWMQPGDSIDIGYDSNPVAPYQLTINLAKNHSFATNDTLNLGFNFDPSVFLDPAHSAIVTAITVNAITVSELQHVMEISIADMYQVSQNDFGGQVAVLFNATGGVPAPGALVLLGTGLLALTLVGQRRASRRL